tara:strand:- start:504 stop:728 length:225 start_codon:yes stop_codon:yes gene_type:complete
MIIEKQTKGEIMVELVTVIKYGWDGGDSKQTITIEGAIKAMDGKGGYTKEYLETKTAEEIANLWNVYIHTAFID